MKEIDYLFTPKQLIKLNPSFHIKAYVEYFLPIFGMMYWERIVFLLRKLKKMDIEFPKILEIGCGFGLFAQNLSRLNPNSEIIATDSCEDIQNENTKITKKLDLDNLVFITVDIQNPIELRGKTFDLIIALDVLEHVEHTSRTLREINNLMHDNTYLLISVPVESITLRIGRFISVKIFDAYPTSHWIGECRSLQEFERLLSSVFEIIWRRGFPSRIAPQLSSYDMFILCKKR